MIKVENVDICGWEAAIRGMRNPMNSWDKSDSHKCLVDFGFDCPMAEDDCEPCYECNDGKYGFCIGVNDFDLMKRLRNAGTDHRKFMRMVVVYADIAAPLYWWKEASTYRVGVTMNSCSTMHKIHAKEFTLCDFSCEHLERIVEDTGGDVAPVWDFLTTLQYTVSMLNKARGLFLETKDKRYWWQMIQLLPASYNQKRTVMLNYEVLANIYKSRKSHKLDEWIDFCKWIETLPYAKELIVGEGDTEKEDTV